VTDERTSRGKDMIVIAVLAVVAVGLLVYLAVDPAGDGGATDDAALAETPAAAATAGELGIERRHDDDPFALGDPAAPVALVVFSDYRCPFCAKFSRDNQPVLEDRFVEPGTLRIEWRDYPLMGEQSMLAARAGRAAAEQGRFWEFNRAVYAAAPERAKAEFTEQALIGFAEQAGVADVDRFTADLRGDGFDAAINADVALANSIGVPSTPAFLINGTPLLGAQPTEDFVRAIDDARAGR